MNPIEKLASSYIYWPELEHQFQNNVSFGTNTLSSFTDILSKEVKAKESSPDNEILEFYALNQYLSSQRLKDNNVLDESLIDAYKLYQNKVNALSQKIFCYLFTICMTETKHSYDLNNGDYHTSEQDLIDWMSQYNKEHGRDPSEKQTDIMRKKLSNACHKTQLSQYEKMAGEFYPEFVNCFNFLDNTFKKYSSDYTNTMIKRMLPSFKDSDLTIENILKTVSIIFKKNSFNHSYGGYSWQNIANHALNFANGSINAEVFVDQAFSLEHNEGSIFNKEIIFKSVGTFSTPTTVSIGNPTLNSSNTIAMSKTKLLLNMQHAGETLNFLALNNITNTQIENIIDNKKWLDSHLKGFDVNKSLKLFFYNLKQEAASYNNSPIVKFLLATRLTSTKIKFEDFLSYTTNKYGDKISILNDKKKATLQLSTDISSQFSIIIHNKENSSTTPLVFEAFDISNIPLNKQDRNILGGKAYGLNEMKKMGLPVPNAVVWTCENSFSFNSHPEEWSKALHSQIPGINLYNKDANGDVMVSIRSGSPVSMPGMMDTVLNVGIDDTNYQFFSNRLGKNTTDECAIRFMKLFAHSYFNLETKWPKNINLAIKKFRKLLEKNGISTNSTFFPLTKEQQIELCLHAVFKSANSSRANAYREHHNMENLGTSAVMQHMVFGNLNHKSCTGVLFSRDCINGNKGLIGEFLVCAQGEDVVAGEVTPQNISEMKKWNLKAYKQISEIASKLEEKTGQIQDIEFTIENGVVYILQCRAAVSSPQANIKILQEKLNDKKITLEEFFIQVEPQALRVGKSVATSSSVDFVGLCANPGIIQGICIQSEQDIAKYSEQAKKQKLGFILIAEETKPQHAELMMRCDAFLTQKGGFTSHAAILARSWGKPCLVGSINTLTVGDIVTMDTSLGVWKGLQVIENKKFNTVVSEIVSSYNIEVTHTAADKINDFKDWRNFGTISHIKKFTKFLDMGYCALMKMSLAAKKQNHFKH